MLEVTLDAIIICGALAGAALIILVSYGIGKRAGESRYRAIAIAARIAEHQQLTDEADKLRVMNGILRMENKRLRSVIVDQTLAGAPDA